MITITMRAGVGIPSYNYCSLLEGEPKHRLRVLKNYYMPSYQTHKSSTILNTCLILYNFQVCVNTNNYTTLGVPFHT